MTFSCRILHLYLWVSRRPLGMVISVCRKANMLARLQRDILALLEAYSYPLAPVLMFCVEVFCSKKFITVHFEIAKIICFFNVVYRGWIYCFCFPSSATVIVCECSLLKFSTKWSLILFFKIMHLMSTHSLYQKFKIFYNYCCSTISLTLWMVMLNKTYTSGTFVWVSDGICTSTVLLLAELGTCFCNLII